ncbi:Protein tas [wastewater metagenome]|uniref:Protein tas n=2 Tax=unclassified sequences TaxID=12908 RepID=A0A5B8R8H8_9ZZZZ|nr:MULTISPECIES: NADP(H)-dependent aldo-keto reductase [Arhodomonas]MCS4505268.1 NADP(H)-dependent aldo-keto reductase [Arhodomonas aquaeolei]QEA05010.1 protein tas [uncultured organism]
MEYRQLGDTDVRVSRLCLGTMTWGHQNTEAEAHAQMDAARERGINFFDTAEMYPVPSHADTWGTTERYIGSYFAAGAPRDSVFLATKCVGPGVKHIRDGRPSYDAQGLRQALEGSLRRLQTDYVDLYQLHWPKRPSNYFGRLGYTYPEEDVEPGIEETLRALADLVDEGKIRYIGLSNETPWGVMRFLQLAERHGLPRVVSVQNPYSLVNRSFEVGLAEIAHREYTGLLAYSPLAFGALTGKYLNGARPEGARLTRYTQFKRYLGEPGETVTARYVALAREHGLDPAQMALAYVNSRPFLTSNIIGATTMEQLHSNMDSETLALPETVIEGIEAIHRDNANPCP